MILSGFKKSRIIQSLVLFFGCLSGFVFGYDLCVIAATLGLIDSHFVLTDETGSFARKDLIVMIFSIGVLFGRLAGIVADKLGRRMCLLISDFIIIVGLVITVLHGHKSFEIFLVSRAMVGVGLGAAFLVSPLYLSEVSPKCHRGIYVSFHEVAVCAGALLGFSSDAIVNRLFDLDPENTSYWRFVMGIACIPGLIQLVVIMFLPESPRWLAERGFESQLRTALTSLGFNDSDEGDVLKFQARSNNTFDDAGKIESPLSCKLISLPEDGNIFKGHIRALLASIAIGLINSGCGFYALQTYSQDVLSQCALYRNDISNVDTFARHRLLPWVGIVKLTGAIFTVCMVERLGRKLLLMTSCILIALAHLVIGLIFTFGTSSSAYAPCIGTFYSIILFWNIGLGPITLLIASELLPTRSRSIANMIMLICMSMVEITYNQIFEQMFYNVSNGFPFWIFMSVSLCGFCICYYCIPETRGITIEDSSKQIVDSENSCCTSE